MKKTASGGETNKRGTCRSTDKDKKGERERKRVGEQKRTKEKK